MVKCRASDVRSPRWRASMAAKFVLPAAIGLPLLGCPTYQINRLPDSEPLAQAQPISSTTDFKRVPSGITLPLSIPGYTRVTLLQYDTAGLDISAGYHGLAPGCPIEMTEYIWPAPRMSFIGADPSLARSVEKGWVDHAYEHWQHEIVQGHPDAVLRSEEPVTKDTVPGKRAVYSIGAQESELLVFIVGNAWVLSYRATYPPPCASLVKQF
jgi:hypothetical protein